MDAVSTVSSYVLMTQAGAQTHWHVDMTGSSVFYQVIVGRKEFWILLPTQNNLEKLHEYHTNRRAQEYEYTLHLIYMYYIQYITYLYLTAIFRSGFLPDMVGIDGPAIHATLYEGDSFFLPAGWPHFVYTPVHSIAFGVNFICGADLAMVAQLYSAEVNTYILF